MTTFYTPGDVLAWVDLETTGLTAADNHVLEVACIVTDAVTLEPIGEPYTAVVAYNPVEVNAIHNAADQFVQRMHTKSGLWDRLTSREAKPLDVVDAELSAWLRHYAPEPRQARIAGSSIRLDLNFLEAHLPDTYAHLHYRSVDVSAIAWDAEAQGHALPQRYDTDDTHQALPDIQRSLQLLRDVRAAHHHHKEQTR